MEKALIAMSGGVDSSVAAALTLRAGYSCVGATMKLFDGEDREGGCCSEQSASDARRTAYRLGMPHYVFNFTDLFAREVMDRFAAGYTSGGTPNPCIDCNRYLKFGKLFERADILGCSVLATGHYAKVERDPASGRYLLKKANCAAKDQSYVLYFLNQEQLARLKFPLGEFADKEEVRRLAEDLGLANARRPDSEDICFVPDGRYADFIERYTGSPAAPGEFRDREGNPLGPHRGIIRYTVGQRRGLGISFGRHMYVTGKDAATGTVTLGPEEELYSAGLLAGDFNWIIEPPRGEARFAVKTRYRAKEAPATARALPDGRVEVRFSEPQRAVAPGQAAVLYDGDTVAGGGVILKAL